jgi:hypothetical protein
MSQMPGEAGVERSYNAAGQAQELLERKKEAYDMSKQDEHV